MAGSGGLIQKPAHEPNLAELRLALIEQAPLFRGMTRSELRQLAERACDRRVPRGQAVFVEGEPTDAVTLLGLGRVKLTQLSAAGDEVILRLMGPGELLGGVGAPAGETYTSSALAMEACHVVCWERKVFDDALDFLPALQRNALRIVAERLRNLEERYRELATERLPQRLAHALLRLVRQVGRPDSGGVAIAMSREELAQMTGTTVFSVSRLISEWESQQILRPRREAVIIDDRLALTRIAEAQPLERPPAGSHPPRTA